MTPRLALITALFAGATGCAATPEVGSDASGAGGGPAASGASSTSGATTTTGATASSGADTGGGGAGVGGGVAGGASSTAAGAGCDHPPPNDPTADDSGLPAGPIVKFTVKVFYIKRPPDDAIVEPTEQGGKWIAFVGDKVVFDATQKNADNVPCQWESEPDYILSDPSCAFQRLPTQNPFLLQMEALGSGELFVSATIDGVASNALVLEVLP